MKNSFPAPRAVGNFCVSICGALRPASPDEVRVLVSDLRDLWRQQADANNLVNRVQVLRHELQDMSASISQARREIAALRPSEDGNDRFSTASNELDAIIVSTERASSEILTSSERILELISKLRDGEEDTGELHSKIEAEVMEIFTACSFQDLTGQRTTKVINVLRYIEQRIGSMIAIWGEDKAPPHRPAAGPGRRPPRLPPAPRPVSDRHRPERSRSTHVRFRDSHPQRRTSAAAQTQAGNQTRSRLRKRNRRPIR